MWQNSELKQRAKDVLKRFGFWTPFFATFIGGILTANPDSVLSVFSESESFDSLLENEEIAGIVATLLLCFVVFSFLFNIFVGYPIMVGMNRFFMENRIGGSKIERIFYVFKSGNYLNVVKTMFIMNLKITLWGLLFIIPGIIKSYQYYMIPYILAENPGISTKRAFELTKEMTRDEKFDIFWLGFTFIGWYFLGLITCGIPVLFVEPYIQATFAELYQIMRDKVHNSGVSNFEELPGFLPEQ